MDRLKGYNGKFKKIKYKVINDKRVIDNLKNEADSEGLDKGEVDLAKEQANESLNGNSALRNIDESKCNHNPNSPNTTLKRTANRRMVNPDRADFICENCGSIERYEKRSGLWMPVELKEYKNMYEENPTDPRSWSWKIAKIIHDEEKENEE